MQGIIMKEIYVFFQGMCIFFYKYYKSNCHRVRGCNFQIFRIAIRHAVCISSVYLLLMFHNFTTMTMLTRVLLNNNRISPAPCPLCHPNSSSIPVSCLHAFNELCRSTRHPLNFITVVFFCIIENLKSKKIICTVVVLEFTKVITYLSDLKLIFCYLQGSRCANKLMCSNSYHV